MSDIITVSSLPPELLGEIFVHCSNAHPDSPLCLRRVSKQFNQVVHSTPRVWDHLTLKLTEATDAACEEKAKLWFANSGSCWVNVKVDVSTPARSPTSSGRSTPRGMGPAPQFNTFNTLRDHSQRVLSLDVSAPAEPDARSLLQCMYSDYNPCFPLFPSPTTFLPSPFSSSSTSPPLESLSIKISSTTPPSLRFSSSHLRLPRLPKLKRLRLTNHTVETFLAFAEFDELRHLAISCPIRFTPLSIDAVVGILRRAGKLEELEIESRIAEGGAEASTPGTMTPTTTPGTPGLPTPLDLGASPASMLTTTATPGQQHSAGEAVTSSGDGDTNGGSHCLVHLPSLTKLSLRINAVPAFLAQLLTPNLDRLHVEDLNGKRAGAERETADVLKQLLVRMELPNEQRVGRGLRVLELLGIEISAAAVLGEGREENSGWEWCFKRMSNLEELSLGKMDPTHVLDILSPPTATVIPQEPFSADQSSSSSTPISHVAADIHTVCPRLHHLSISAISHNVVPSQIARFRSQRPNVRLDVDVVKDPFFQTSRTGPVDFLSLYSDMGLARKTSLSNSSAGKCAATAGPSRSPSRTRTRGFGPWLVLGSGGASNM